MFFITMLERSNILIGRIRVLLRNRFPTREARKLSKWFGNEAFDDRDIIQINSQVKGKEFALLRKTDSMIKSWFGCLM